MSIEDDDHLKQEESISTGVWLTVVKIVVMLMETNSIDCGQVEWHQCGRVGEEDLVIDIVDDDRIFVLAGLTWAIRDTAGEMFLSISILSNQVWFDGRDDDLCIGGYDLHG
ncbi:Hypothetical predicted protein [Paramuricea clavata]|uniref:Uncharacterized protein n=1 Tax=Paramuricea clavata TaxID=317549 RepID=A0A6S7FE89_PARCT|nr:Hypothetical predicted protein [Paramuricea clavata]